jgi:recombination protein U
MRGYANRGKQLEANILTANRYYDMSGLAVVVQMPTPVKILRIVRNQVTGVLQKSTIDFYGTIKGGRAIYFDAKETKKPSFPLSNLEEHQAEHMRKQEKVGATCFIVLEFTQEKEYFLIPFPILEAYLRAAAEGGRKSIPLKDCQERQDIFKLSTSQGYLNYLEPVINIYQ